MDATDRFTLATIRRQIDSGEKMAFRGGEFTVLRPNLRFHPSDLMVECPVGSRQAFGVLQEPNDFRRTRELLDVSEELCRCREQLEALRQQKDPTDEELMAGPLVRE